MKKILISGVLVFIVSANCLLAQDVKAKDVPAAVKTALLKKYPAATKISWEKENGNFEANWGGRSGEDNAAQFSPTGDFVEYEMAIAINKLPANVAKYVKEHYTNATIKEAGKITNAAGVITYEAEVKGKDLVFDVDGNFIKVDEEG
ncbi:MAG TPA: PepSY-like domain-containing protein [Chitinophagaceae bacterium]|nr:PepSY-like domain-containing protein [Chitinophagaceae bacterium]